MDSDAAIEEIKRRADLAAIVQQYVPLQHSGRRLKARCPFHQEKTPSFFVDPQAGFFKCFGCGVGGDVFTFLMKIEGLTFPEAAARLANQLGLPWRAAPADKARLERRRGQYSALEIAAEHFRRNLQSPRGAAAREYLEQRGLRPETLETYGLGLALDDWEDLARHLSRQGVPAAVAREAGLIRARQSASGHYDVFRHRIMFPITDASGRVLGFGGRTLDPEESAKYLNSPDTPVFKKGRHVYGLPQARQAMTASNLVVLVEGYTDVLALHQAGFEQVVAALGTALTEDHVRLLSRYVETVVMCYDADAAGKAAALRSLEVFERAGVDAQVITLPPGLDPDELVRSHGLEGWEQCLTTRQSLAEYELDMTFARYHNQGANGLARAATRAVDVLLKIEQRPRRDALLRRAAELWGARDPAAIGAMQRALMLELRRRMPRPSRTRPRQALDEDLILQSLAQQSDPIPPGRRQLERELLSMALQEQPCAEALFRQVQVEDFGLLEHRLLAQALFQGLQRDSFAPQEIVDHLPEGGVRSIGVELLLAPLNEVSEKDIDLAAAKLRSYRGPAGLQPVYEIPQGDELEPADSAPEEENFEALRARLTQRMAQGEISRDDPDYRRYLQLVQRTRGRGDYDFWFPPGQARRLQQSEGQATSDEPERS
ncbi:MAG: DNA primase [candidate division WS1 bacterium]|nr:DNA primase [candidate division WS1 bacterium]